MEYKPEYKEKVKRFRGLALDDFLTNSFRQETSIFLKFTTTGYDSQFEHQTDFSLCDEPGKDIVLKITGVNDPFRIIGSLIPVIDDMDPITLVFGSDWFKVFQHDDYNIDGNDNEICEYNYQELAIFSEDFHYDGEYPYIYFKEAAEILEEISTIIQPGDYFDYTQYVGPRKMQLDIRRLRLCDKNIVESISQTAKGYFLNEPTDVSKKLRGRNDFEKVLTLYNKLFLVLHKIEQW